MANSWIAKVNKKMWGRLIYAFTNKCSWVKRNDLRNKVNRLKDTWPHMTTNSKPRKVHQIRCSRASLTKLISRFGINWWVLMDLWLKNSVWQTSLFARRYLPISTKIFSRLYNDSKSCTRSTLTLYRCIFGKVMSVLADKRVPESTKFSVSKSNLFVQIKPSILASLPRGKKLHTNTITKTMLTNLTVSSMENRDGNGSIKKNANSILRATCAHMSSQSIKCVLEMRLKYQWLWCRWWACWIVRLSSGMTSTLNSCPFGMKCSITIASKVWRQIGTRRRNTLPIWNEFVKWKTTLLSGTTKALYSTFASRVWRITCGDRSTTFCPN